MKPVDLDHVGLVQMDLNPAEVKETALKQVNWRQLCLEWRAREPVAAFWRFEACRG